MTATYDPDLVSVIIPCYNYARYLGDAIGSVLNQTYQHYEVVVVDDGSTDNTAEVAARYPGVRYIYQKNQGISAARNTGARHSRGGFLVFLDPDDMLLRTALEIGVRCLKANPDCALVSGNCQFIAADGTPIRTPQSPQSVDKEHYLALLYFNYIWNPANVMYRREVFESVGGFDPAIGAAEDCDLYLRITRRFSMRCHGKIVAKYRRHGVNLSQNAEKMLKYMLLILRSQAEHVRGDKRYELQLKRGISLQREHYGRRVVRRAYISIRNRRDWIRGVSGMSVLLGSYQKGLLLLFILLARRIAKSLTGRGRKATRRQKARREGPAEALPGNRSWLR